MTGSIDNAGRALIPIRLREAESENEAKLDAWVDTGFTGELVLPQKLTFVIKLTPGLAVRATLADGSEVVLNTFACRLDWFGDWKSVEVVVNSGEFPLLGVGLLRDHVLHADYVMKLVTLD